MENSYTETTNKEIGISNLRRRFQDAVQKRSVVEPALDKICKFLLPYRGSISGQVSPGQLHTRDLYDSTGIRAADILTSTIHGGLTNPALKWVALEFDDYKLSLDTEANDYLSTVTSIIMKTLNSPYSFFVGQNHQMLYDMIVLGTGIMYVEEDKQRKGGICFKTIPLSEIYILEDWREKIDTVFRKFKLTARQAAQQWKEKVLPERIKQSLYTSPDTEFEFVHAVMPSEDIEKMGLKPSALDFTGIYFCEGENTILETHGYEDYHPYIVSRYQKLTSEIYGRSPSWNTICDVAMANQMRRAISKNAEFQTNPIPLLSDDGILGRQPIKPGMPIVGGLISNNGGRRVEFLEFGGRIDSALKSYEGIKKDIQDSFYMNQLLFRDGPQMTATEVVQISEEQLRLLGPQIGRITSEYLCPLIDRIFNIQFKANLYGSLPRSVSTKKKNVKINVNFLGPLVQLQKQKEFSAIDQTIAEMAPLLQVQPDLLDLVKFDELFRDKMIKKGANLKYLNTAKEIDKIRTARAEKQAQMEQMQMGLEIADKAAKLTKAGVFGSGNVPASPMGMTEAPIEK